MKSFISCSVKYEKPSHHPKAFFVRVKKVDAGLSCILYFGILNLYFVRLSSPPVLQVRQVMSVPG